MNGTYTITIEVLNSKLCDESIGFHSDCVPHLKPKNRENKISKHSINRYSRDKIVTIRNLGECLPSRFDFYSWGGEGVLEKYVYLVSYT